MPLTVNLFCKGLGQGGDFLLGLCLESGHMGVMFFLGLAVGATEVDTGFPVNLGDFRAVFVFQCGGFFGGLQGRLFVVRNLIITPVHQCEERCEDKAVHGPEKSEEHDQQDH